MKRWALALVALSGIAAGLAQADYLILIVNVGQAKHKPMNPGVGVGMVGQVGALGAVGQVGQLGQVGQVGQVGQAGNPMRPMGIIGAAGIAPMGQMGGAMGQKGMAGGKIDPAAVPQLVPVLVEVEATPPRSALHMFDAGQPALLKHKWGTATLIRKSGPLEVAAVYRDSDNKLYPNVNHRFTAEQTRSSKDSSPDNTLRLAEWALSHGLNHKFDDLMEKLAKDDKDNAKLAAYQKIKAELARRLDRAPSAPWFDRLAKGYKKDEKSPHYTILHNLPDNDASEIASRAHRLEEHMKGFYYWWALRGQILPMPRERLVALIASTPDEFKHFHRGLSAGPIVSDGFQSARENVVVLIVHPLAEKYDMLNRFGDQYFRSPETNRTNSLKGKLGKPTEEKVQAAAIALALKAMEDASERASISHQGTQQLLYATELLPRHVTVPQWVSFGMSSVFATHPSSPWTTLGAPSPAYCPPVQKQLRDDKKVEGATCATLKAVVTDAYFRGGAAMTAKAQQTAWGLCYFLARKDADKLRAYFRELGRMPRDLELDEEVLLGCFARAFDAWDSNTKTVNIARLQTVADKWANDMFAAEVEGMKMLESVQQLFVEYEKSQMPSANPTPRPTGPGGGVPNPQPAIR